jgi:AraC-like DNA-binding protein
MAEYCLYTEAIGPDCGGLGAAFRETRFWIGQDDQAIFANLAELERELAERAAGYRLAARDLLSTVIVKAIRAYRREPATVADTEPGAGIGRSRYLVIESAFLWDYATITLPGLADRLGLGTRQTDRLLSEMYGQSFDDKKAQARMSAAAMLLTHTDESVTAIAERTGFSSLEHFGNAFRKRYRVSPTAYRRSRS